MIHRTIVLMLLTLMIVCGTACAEVPSTQPVASLPKIIGIEYLHETRDNPPMHLHSAIVDLTNPKVHVVVRKGGEVSADESESKWQTKLLRTSDIAKRDQLDVAVNGDFFMSRDVLKTAFKKVPYYVGNRAAVCGIAMTDGELWSTRDCDASLIVDADGKVSIAKIKAQNIPTNAKQIISGMTQIVTAGKNTGVKKDVAPRTAVGIDRDGKKMVLLVVDGRREKYSAGMNLHDLAEEMIRLGCHNAIQLDGGGSSTMVMRHTRADQPDEYKVMNRPSDGHDLPLPMSVERAIANVLAVKVEN